MVDVNVMLDELLELDSGLTDGEVDWIEKFARQRKEKGFLSKEQCRIIENIWDRRLGRSVTTS